MTCGVTSSKHQSLAASNGNGPLLLRRAIDSAKVQEVELSSQGAARGPHSDPGEGYTCGLWMLFHYLSGGGDMAWHGMALRERGVDGGVGAILAVTNYLYSYSNYLRLDLSVTIS